MKRTLVFSTIIAATLGLISCEKHDFKTETKRLYKSHGESHDDNKDGH